MSDRPGGHPARLTLFNGVIWCCGCCSDITDNPRHNCHVYLRQLYRRMSYLESVAVWPREVKAKYMHQTQQLIDAYCKKEGISNEQ